jgi:hypothetical protein
MMQSAFSRLRAPGVGPRWLLVTLALVACSDVDPIVGSDAGTSLKTSVLPNAGAASNGHSGNAGAPLVATGPRAPPPPPTQRRTPLCQKLTGWILGL